MIKTLPLRIVCRNLWIYKRESKEIKMTFLDLRLLNNTKSRRNDPSRQCTFKKARNPAKS
ncbi:unnamed protein product [Acanthoscelides obtectus]|uniref:Uncharacterized protein n=1 Tax=Acanthoscelides obtectus TaxID=200917 RepID=A0A9P0LC07_ACAOB|nr:unnamed protein product [Acanthoscelides obtectus]CAK1640502.1 hypothetical protein AOBTE_LOCUS11764 [Acanthoscelides obtectus]